MGKIDAIAKGARKAGSRLAGVSDPLTLGHFSLAKGKVNRFVSQAQPIRAFRGLRQDYDRLQHALALLELVVAIFPYDQERPGSLEFLEAALGAIETHAKPTVALVWAEVKLLFEEGAMPNFTECNLTGTPVGDWEPWLSPSAGGVVRRDAASKLMDAFPSSIPVVVGLSKIQAWDAPPPNLRQAGDCLRALLPFWKTFADCPLFAHEELLNSLQLDTM